MGLEGEEGSLGTRPTHAPLLGFSGDSSVPVLGTSRAGKFGTNWRRGGKSTQKYLPGTGSKGCCDAPGPSAPLQGGEVTSRCVPLIINN